MKKVTLAYTAGVFDGEGSVVIGVSYQQRPRNNGVRSKSYRLFVSIENTNAELIQWLKATYGGFIIHTHRSAPRTPLWAWRLQSNQAMAFLNLIKPYLFIKKAQADLAIEFQAKRKKTPTVRTDKELALAEAQRILMHSYNAKRNQPLKAY